MSKFFRPFLTFSLLIYFSSAQISDKRLCVDPECKSPVSLAKTLRRYYSPDTYRLSFGPNEDVVIFSKSAGSNENLWGAEINGKRGYIPKHLVRETKMMKQPEILVGTELIGDTSQPHVPLKEDILNPSKVKQNFEVIDGTTVYMDARIEDVEENRMNSLEVSPHSLNTTLSNDTNEETVSFENSTITTEPEKEEKPELGSNENFDDENNVVTSSQNDVAESSLEDNVVEDIDEHKVIDTQSGVEDEGVNLGDTVSDINEIKKETINQNEGIETLDDLERESGSKENLTSLFTNEPHTEIQSAEAVIIEFEKDHKSDVKEFVDSSTPIESNDILKNLGKNELEMKKESNSFDTSHNPGDSNNSVDTNQLNNDKVEVDQESIISDDKSKLLDSSINLLNSPDEGIINLVDTSQLNNDNIEVDQESIISDDKSKLLDSSINILNNLDDEIKNSQTIVDSNLLNEMEKKHEAVENISENESHKEHLLVGFSKNIQTPNVNVLQDIPTSSNPYQKSSEEKEIYGAENSTAEVNSLAEDNVMITTQVIPETKEMHSIDSDSIEMSEKKVEITRNQDSNPLNDETELNEKIVDTLKDYVNEFKIPGPSSLPENVLLRINRVNSENDNPVINSADAIEEIYTQSSVGDSSDIEKLGMGGVYHNGENADEKTPTVFSYFAHNQENNLHVTNEEDSKLSNSETLGNQEDELKESPSAPEVSHAGDFCTRENCPSQGVLEASQNFILSMDLLNFSSDIFLYLVTTAASVIVFLLGHFLLDKSRREGPLIIKINKLEKEFLILLKEKELLAEQVQNNTQEVEYINSEDMLNSHKENESLKERIQILEDQVQTLEKELENSTEVGLELNRMLSDVLSSENAGETLMLNIEGLQAQLAEQQGIVSNMKEILSLKETENHELNLELDITNKKVVDLQSEVDKLLINIIKLEEDKELFEKTKETQTIQFEEMIHSLKKEIDDKEKIFAEKIDELNNKLSVSEHNLQLKSKEYEGLKSSMQQIKEIKNANTLESLLEVTSIKAELEQLKADYQSHCDKLRREKEANSILEKKVKLAEEEADAVRIKFDEADKSKLELQTKLQVLTNYFKDKEEQLQKELSKYETMWSTKQGEATSTSERMKYLQGEVQNYKAQNEILKQEIVSQEVELKGQISVLEKKVHENWVTARQAERRLEELKQEAAQLRNRLTLRERSLQDDRLHNRIQSPLEQTEDIPVSPLHLESPASPPPLFNSRDHITKSPPILGMPPPFLPPPPTGAPFLPPPPLPFMPPPPHDMFPGDHRPPPLGRMSSPPLNTRYSPNRAYSPYDRSPSPSYDESEYGTSPVHRRNYTQYSRRRDHRPAAMDKFNGRSGTLSSGSDNSNESLDEMNHQKV